MDMFSGSGSYKNNVIIQALSGNQDAEELKEELLSIIRQLPTEAKAIEPIVQLVVQVMSPHKIFMLKSGSKSGAQVFIDLLIIMPDDVGDPFEEYERVFDIDRMRRQQITCSLHSVGRVVERMEKGNLFYNLNCIDKNIIYDDCKLTLPPTTNRALRNMKIEAKERFAGSYDVAVAFFKSAEYLRNNVPTPIAAFYLHQAVELSYRAVLTTINGYCKKTHVIKSLMGYARRIAPRLNSIFPCDNWKERKLLEVLENCYLSPRYCNTWVIDEDTLSTLFDRTAQVLEAAQDILQEALTGLSEDEGHFPPS